jgi:hypothetical protein
MFPVAKLQGPSTAAATATAVCEHECFTETPGNEQ